MHGEIPVFTLEKAELAVDESPCELPCAVGTEVEEDYAVVGLDGRCRLAVFGDDARQDEFIRQFSSIRITHGFLCAFKPQTFAEHHRVVRHLGSAVIAVAIHRVVSPNNGSDPAAAKNAHPFFKCANEACAAVHSHVAPVGEAMHENLGKPRIFRNLDQREKMLDMAVYAAVGEQPEEVQRGVVCAAVLDRANDSGSLRKAAVLRSESYLRQILIHYAPGADVRVPDLGIAHLPVREAHVKPGCTDQRMGVFFLQSTNVFYALNAHGVAVFIVRVAKAVEYDKRG